VVYDDLSRHADAYRDLCLLLRRPVGRERYPADLLSMQARLLERSARLAERFVIVPGDADETRVTDDWSVIRNPDNSPVVFTGPPASAYHDRRKEVEQTLAKYPGHKLVKVPSSGGSLTALAIVETQGEHVSLLVPSNLLALADRTLRLRAELFHAGIRPALDA